MRGGLYKKGGLAQGRRYHTPRLGGQVHGRQYPAPRRRTQDRLARPAGCGTDPEFWLRAHILLLLDDGQPWALLVDVLFTSTTTINRWRKRFLADGLDAMLARPRRSRSH